jgi:AmmeMemoRadiSam system protein A
MFYPASPHTKIALAAILNYFGKALKKDFHPGEIPSELFNNKCGCFVSLHKKDGELRGCIGTVEPHEKHLYDEISRNAVSAAFYDSRFSPLTTDELDDIEISVDVLTIPEEINNEADLDPMIYGVIVSDGSYKKAVLLPSIPGVETVDKQLEIVKRKAGLSFLSNKNLIIYRFTSTRYH